MFIDPVFWDIAGMPENNAAPLSLRTSGAFGCIVPSYFEYEFADENNPREIAQRCLSWADDALELLTPSLRTDAFLEFAEQSASTNGYYLETYVATLVGLGRQDEAAEVCRRSLAAGQTGHFHIGGFDDASTFLGLTLKYLAGRLNQ